MSNQQDPQTNKRYVSLSLKELEALGKCKGEAVRLYLAISSCAWGTDVSCYPRWKKCREIMGKNISDRRCRELAVHLEEAGLLRRYEKDGDRYRYFYLPLKHKVIKERAAEEREAQKEVGEAQKEPGREAQKEPVGEAQKEPV